MILLKRLVIACFLISLAAAASRARAGFEQICQNWENAKAGASAGDGVDRDGADVTDPVVTSATAAGGRQSVAFNFIFNPTRRTKVMEAERARLTGPVPYHDALASGGRAVGGFGLEPGSAIVFDNAPTTGGLMIYYDHTVPHGWRPDAAPRTTQCGLYLSSLRIATLYFNDSGDWFTPFDSLYYDGMVGGTLRLQTDAEDVGANKGPCANIDKIVLGPPHLLPSIEVRLKNDSPPLGNNMTYFNCALRAPRGFHYQLGLEDSAAVVHWSRPDRQQRGDAWEHLTVALASFRPRLEPAKAGKLKAILLRATGDEAGMKGTVFVDEAKFTEGWPSNPPAGNPFPPSTAIAGLRFTGRFRGYTNADTWFPSWAADGNLYSPYTDGVVGDVVAISCAADATTGMARIEGDDPLNLRFTPLGTFMSRPWPFSGRYPCGSLLYNGTWYYGTAIINDRAPDGSGLCQGPLVGFRTSQDYGKSWRETPRTPLGNLFDEQVDVVKGGLSRIKMSSPHFVDFGKNMKNSPDGRAYLVAHGCTNPASPQTWIRGDEVYLARVKPSHEAVNDRTQYEFFAGYDAKGQPVWGKRFRELKPMFAWPGRAGCVTVTYDAPLKKYLMCVSNGETNIAPFDTYLLESDHVWGPWRLITYLEQFGKQAYFVNIPSKFISGDGRTMWLAYSANWSGYPQNPRGSSYGLCFHEMRLLPGK